MNNAGIDKVKFVLNPVFLNPQMPWHIRSDDALTLHPAGNFTFLAIHAEYCNPFIDYRLTIAVAVYELVEKKVFLFPNDNPCLTCFFIWNNLDYFLLGVSQVEIFLDFPKGKVFIDEDAIKNGDIIQDTDKRNGTPRETFYTSDYVPDKRKSSFCVYNKREKLLHDRHISKEKIDEMGVYYRIEARLSRENCPYLDIANLSGTFDEIFKRFLPFVAVSFYNHLYSHIGVKGKSNTYWTRLVRRAEKGKTKCFDSGKLKKSEPIQEIPKNGTVRRQMQRQLLGKYYEHVENSNIPIEIGEEDMKKGYLVGKLVSDI